MVFINDQISIFSIMEKPKEVKDKSIPKGLKLKPGELYCPYCQQKVIFIKDKKNGVYKCSFCGISKNDYWVKKVNKIKK